MQIIKTFFDFLIESQIPSKVNEQTIMNQSAHPPPPTGFTNPPLSSSSSNSSVAGSPISDKNKPSRNG